VLTTLPEREFRAGVFESLKCGVIGNAELFRLIEEQRDKVLARDPALLEWLITASVKLKASVVAEDEREGGRRRVLNFGHTIGHALEAETRYQTFLHGEAVAWGMIAAARIAAATGRLPGLVADQIAGATLALGPLPKVKVKPRSILQRLKSDKKTRSGKTHFVLPTSIGQVEIVNDVPAQTVLEAVHELRRISAVRA
jgi:3-dehydroquinate synthase